MKKILITGSEGIVGQILVKNLANDYELIGLDKAESSDLSQFYSVDIADEKRLKRVGQEIGPVDVVIHLAGDSFHKAGWDYVLPANIIGMKNVLEMARDNGSSKIIYASSGHVVGGWEDELIKTGKIIDESAEVRPDGWYGLSKCFGENLARMYHDQYDTQIYCLRIGAVLVDDKPRTKRDRYIWFSHHDLIITIRAMIESRLRFGIYFGVSDNEGRIWNNSRLKTDFNLKFN